MTTMLLLLMACGVLAGLPAALLVFAVDPRRCGDDDDDNAAQGGTPEVRAAWLLRSEMTQAELGAYMANEVG